jgi:ABC-type branched-subunit amino acid transport system substrate-binding protein
MIDNDNVFAILGQVGTHTCQAAMPVAVNRGVPFFGGFSGAKFLRKPWNRLVVNYRASYIDETAAMIALFADLMFMAKISIMYQDDGFGYAGLEGVEVALRARSMTIHSYGMYDRTDLDIDPGLAQIQLKEEPEGIVMIGAYVPLSNFVKKAKLSYPRVYFSTVSSVGAYGFQKYLGDAESRFHVLVTQVVDSPFNTSVPIIAEYEKARSGLDAYEGATSKGDFISVEGYIIGRFAAVVPDGL